MSHTFTFSVSTQKKTKWKALYNGLIEEQRVSLTAPLGISPLQYQGYYFTFCWN